MKSQEIRRRFLDFFATRGHEIVPSSGLIPVNDDTLLFANAGMNQFKDIFTGRESPGPRKRATSIQKCVRAGGKHNDLENVGPSPRHHTFFEMLGNFSFGDYFKKEAIEYAWEFLTGPLNIAEKSLRVTVHHTDKEAREIWEKTIGLPPSKIQDEGDEENFWEMAEGSGPCGPCSEIFHGQVEVWNLVFMQYEQDGTKRIPLSYPSIDTGAGLERLAAVAQGAQWNYETDLFTPIIQHMGPGPQSESQRVVADHVRAATMLITDGAMPSAEGRGHVLRRIIRRAIFHAQKLNVSFPFLPRLVGPVFEILGETYPQNAAKKELAVQVLKDEEEKFLQTLDLGLKFFEQSLQDSSQGKLSGEAIFKLYDTYGLPVDLTQLLARKRGATPDLRGFEAIMKERKKQSQKTWKGAGGRVDKTTFYDVRKRVGPTKFVGHQVLEARSRLEEILDLGDGSKGLIFGQTPFYGESGGQVGDRGVIGDVPVVDTQKPLDDLIVHVAKGPLPYQVGEELSLKVDVARRSQTAKNHSATHLLQGALRRVLGEHVGQAGSLVGPHKLRFDFTHPRAMTQEELREVEDLVNAQVAMGSPVLAKHMSMEQALERGALALFGEKYAQEVRVLEMGDFSLELCGGAHVANTLEIGLFVITSESSLSSGVRRIEALTGPGALQFFRQRSDLLKTIEGQLQARGEGLLEELKKLKQKAKGASKAPLELPTKLDCCTGPRGGRLHFGAIGQEGALMTASDQLISQCSQGLLLLTGPARGGKRPILLRRAKDSPHPWDCQKILKALFTKFPGRGGGRADLSQGSCEAGPPLSHLAEEICRAM